MAPGQPAGWMVTARAAAAHVFVDDLESPELGDPDRHHLNRVLRLRPGELVSTVDGLGGWRPCSFVDGGGLDPAGEIDRPPPVTPEITIGLALVKGERPEWAVQKLTEIGVDRVVPLSTTRSVVRWEAGRADRHLQRLREVARQAAMQSRRLRLPVVDDVRALSDLMVAEADLGARVAIATMSGQAPTLEYPTILVGPEGGWTPEELEAAPAWVDLGPTVLRTETAALVAASFLSGLRYRLLSDARPERGPVPL